MPTSIHPPLLNSSQALFLDFDGTLVNLAPRPECVRPDARLIDVLRHCQAVTAGAMAVLTGRRLESVDGFLSPLKFPAAGLHGAQRRERPGGAAVELARPVMPLPDFIEAVALHEGLWIEDKGASLSLHYREVPALGDLALQLLKTAVAGRPELEVVSGKFVHEVRPQRLDKGVALRQFMLQPPFAGRQPVFLGDDATDEDAIEAAQSLGGFGVKVGPGATRAQYSLLDPQAVLLWLQASTLPAMAA